MDSAELASVLLTARVTGVQEPAPVWTVMLDPPVTPASPSYFPTPTVGTAPVIMPVLKLDVLTASARSVLLPVYNI